MKENENSSLKITVKSGASEIKFEYPLKARDILYDDRNQIKTGPSLIHAIETLKKIVEQIKDIDK